MDIKRGNIEIDNGRGKGQNVNVSMAKLKEHSLLKDEMKQHWQHAAV